MNTLSPVLNLGLVGAVGSGIKKEPAIVALISLINLTLEMVA